MDNLHSGKTLWMLDRLEMYFKYEEDMLCTKDLQQIPTWVFCVLWNDLLCTTLSG